MSMRGLLKQKQVKIVHHIDDRVSMEVLSSLTIKCVGDSEVRLCLCHVRSLAWTIKLS